jgi:hypothetical protein
MSPVAFELLMGRLRKAGLLNLAEECPTPFAGKQPFQLKYLGGYAPPIEGILCILVGFFHGLFQTEAESVTPFAVDFLTSFSACVTIPLVEASRANRPLLLGFPLIFGILYQNLGGGVIIPLYWALFLATTRDKAVGSQIDQASAESVLFGLVVGFALPTAAMAYTGAIQTIAFWQAFPLWISVFQHLHLLFRPSRTNSGSGHRTVQATYTIIFLVSTAMHLRTLSIYGFDVQRIADAFFPSLAMPDAKKGHTGLTSSVHFLQWDMVFIFGSTFLASLWFAESMVQGVLLTVWSALASVVLSPGAAVCGIFMWREAKLKQTREKQVPAIKRAKAQ